METFFRVVLALLMTGNYLLFWPLYRALHRKRTQRRQALFRLFLLELLVYVIFTGSLMIAVLRIPDFHHGGFLLAGIGYFAMAVVFWLVTYGVWADNHPYEID